MMGWRISSYQHSDYESWWLIKLPKTNVAPEHRPSHKEPSVPTSNHPFSGAMLNFWRVVIQLIYRLPQTSINRWQNRCLMLVRYEGFTVKVRWVLLETHIYVLWCLMHITIPPNRIDLYGGFLQWWYPTTMGFPTKNDHFEVFWE